MTGLPCHSYTFVALLKHTCQELGWKLTPELIVQGADLQFSSVDTPLPLMTKLTLWAWELVVAASTWHRKNFKDLELFDRGATHAHLPQRSGEEQGLP
jgi:hypothetical protein